MNVTIDGDCRSTNWAVKSHSRHQDFCVLSMVFQFMVYALALSTAQVMSMVLTRMFD